MTGATAQTSQSDQARSYAVRIEAHLARLAQGHDPLGHLFAIERLARAARAERWAGQRQTERGDSRWREP